MSEFGYVEWLGRGSNPLSVAVRSKACVLALRLLADEPGGLKVV